MILWLVGIIRNKNPRPVECLEDPEVRKRKWTLPLGQVQLLSCYDSRAHILYVTIIRARKLQTRRPNGDARPDPLVRCVLLPGRKAENERRTRYLSLTSDPEWHQTMVSIQKQVLLLLIVLLTVFSPMMVGLSGCTSSWIVQTSIRSDSLASSIRRSSGIPRRISTRSRRYNWQYE